MDGTLALSGPPNTSPAARINVPNLVAIVNQKPSPPTESNRRTLVQDFAARAGNHDAAMRGLRNRAFASSCSRIRCSEFDRRIDARAGADLGPRLIRG